MPLTGNDEKKITLLGVASKSPVYGGTGSGSTDASRAINFRTAMEESGFTVNDAVYDWYVNSGYERERINLPGGTFGNSLTLIDEAPWSEIDAIRGNSMNDSVAVFVLGRVGGEGRDLFIQGHHDGKDGDYLQLNDNEISILNGLKELKDEGTIKKIVVLINSANAVSAGFLDDPSYGIDAALWIGSVGQSGCRAVADILAGTVNPSGRLADTFYTDNKLNPVQSNFGAYTYTNAEEAYGSISSYFTSYVVYKEGIYVGYKYAETRYEDVMLNTPNAGNFNYDEVVQYPFGYGLSYTTFDYQNFTVEKSGSGRNTVYTATVDVTNTGSVAGKKSVAIYLQKPFTDYDKTHEIEKAAIELVGYGKTDMLSPDETEKITVEIPEYYFTSYDALGTGAYILDEGDYYLTVGESSHDAVNNVLKAKANLTDGDASLTFRQHYSSGDETTYAYSMGTGNKVNSLFGLADINRYSGKGSNSVRYFSRTNWRDTVTEYADGTQYEKLSLTSQMVDDLVLDDEDIDKVTNNEDKFPTYGSAETNYQLIDLRVDGEGNEIAYDDPIWQEYLDQFTFEQIGAICGNGLRMTEGVPEQGKPQTLDQNGPGGVNISYSTGENGYANILDDPDKDTRGTGFPCNVLAAATFNDELIQKMGEMIGEDCMWAGYAGLYGTGVNIHRSPYAGRNFEYFSEDSILSGRIVSSETRGIQSKGVYVYNKHFALNDQEDDRMGVGVWANEQSVREIYLRAFELPIIDADAKCVMSAYNRFGTIWSSACHELMTDWLRGEAGLNGFAVTDYYIPAYMSKPHMALAGNDIPDGNTRGTVGNYTERAVDFMDYAPGGAKANATVALAMRESAHRVLFTVVHSRGMDGLSSNTRLVPVTPWWKVVMNAAIGSFAVLLAITVVWTVVDAVRYKNKNKSK